MPNNPQTPNITGLARWEAKAIGRIPRFENTTYEKVTNFLYENSRQAFKTGARVMFGQAAGAGKNIRPFRQKYSHQIMGKQFSYDDNLIIKAVKGGGKAIVGASMGVANWAANKILSREYFFPSGTQVANNAFSGRITFDQAMCTKMHNACGYMPSADRLLSSIYDEVSQVDDSFTDDQWRQQITPHVLRAAFQKELENCFDAIRNMHTQTSVGFNRELMVANMQLAAKHLGDIFYQFSLDMANNTDYLEAPLTVFPEKRVLPNVELTGPEAKLLKNVTKESLHSSSSALTAAINAAAGKVPKMTADRALELFHSTLTHPVKGPDGNEIPYAPGQDPVEDNRRVMRSILTIRDLKREHQDKGFFRRRFGAEGRLERDAIETMRQTLSRTLNMDLASIDRMTDLNMPLEKGLDLSEIMDIAPINEVAAPSPMEQVTTAVKEAVQITGEAISNATTVVTQKISQIDEVVSDGVSRAIMGDDFMKDVNLFDDDDMDLIGGMAPSVSQDQQPQQKSDPKEAKEEPPKENQPTEESGGIMQTLWNGAAYAASYLNPFSYWKSSPADPTAQMITELQTRQKEQAAATGAAMATPMDFLRGVSRLLYYKSLEVSLKDKTITAEEQEQLRNSLTEEAVNAGSEKIYKDPAIKKLTLFTKGKKSTYTNFLKDASQDPAVVNDVFKDYLSKTGTLAAGKESAKSPKQELPVADPAKNPSPVVPGNAP